MAKAELDRMDLLLLAELQRDGRLPDADLAERVHLSPSACLRRVQRLERDGVIAGYRAELEPERIGLGLQAFVRVQLRQHDRETVDAFAAFVTAWDEVVACHALTGDMDYLLQIAVRDLEHFRSEEHTSELQSLMRISYAVFCLKKKQNTHNYTKNI